MPDNQFDFSDLPHETEAEEAVVGACFASRSAIREAIEILGTTGEQFYSPNMAVLYETIVALDARNVTLDAPVVKQHLRSQPSAVEGMSMLEIIGGEATVDTALSSVTWPENAGHYADIIWGAHVRRKMIRAAANIANLGYFGNGETHHLISLAETAVYELRTGESRYGAISAEVAAARFWDQFTRQVEDPEYNRGWLMGIQNLDSILGHVDPGRLIVMAGRPGFGKTTSSLFIAKDMAIDRGEPVMIAVYEQDAGEHVRTLVAMLTGIDSQILKSPHLLEEHELEACAQAVATINSSPLWFIELGDPVHVTSTAKRVSAEAEAEFGKPLAMLIVDYLGLMPPMPKSRANTRDQEVGEISRHLKLFSKEQQLVTILISQLNRGSEHRANHRPLLSDLRESGNIEQDADIVIFVYCALQYMTDQERRRALEDYQEGYEPYEQIVAKWRAGRTGTADLAWQKSTGRIYSLAGH